MVQPAIIDGVKKYLNKLSETGLSVNFGVVFGSYATGSANKWSDIDLIVVSSDFDIGITRAQVNKLWHIAARVDSRIEPIPCGRVQWQNDRSNAIIEAARIEGQMVNPV
ncbi:MAG: Nucleotidyltransferase domain protein [Planctomycetes bacterium ADurb.Bin401]|nr:MAG: Nucleotidyltransferase domain protein [Planctomycetes bacterium ADurb.Bin401]